MIKPLAGLATGAMAPRPHQAKGPDAAGRGHEEGPGAAGGPNAFAAQLAARATPRPAVRTGTSTGAAFTPGWDEPPASAGEAARLRWAAEQLEALFLEQLWRGMRRTVMKSGMLDGPGVQLFEEMLDQERARIMAGTGALGLADLVYEQMSRYIDTGGQGRTSPGAGE